MKTMVLGIGTILFGGLNGVTGYDWSFVIMLIGIVAVLGGYFAKDLRESMWG